VKYIVFHTYYGCGTGCCGHTVVSAPDDFQGDPLFDLEDSEDEEIHNFEFSHPYGESEEGFKAFAEKMVRAKYGEAHVQDLDWEHCIIEDD